MKSAAADFDTARRVFRGCQATEAQQMASTDKCTADRRALEGTAGCIDRLPMTLTAPPHRAVSPRNGGAHDNEIADTLSELRSHLESYFCEVEAKKIEAVDVALDMN